MNLSGQLARHLRDVHFGGNWTSVCLKAAIEDVSWQQATAKVHSFNTIAALLYHINYFIAAVTKVLQGSTLDSKDALSFDHALITRAEDWQALVNKSLADAETLAGLIEQLPEEKLWADFEDRKYGSYYHNIQGIIEHTHYHLGQIGMIKRLLQVCISS